MQSGLPDKHSMKPFEKIDFYLNSFLLCMCMIMCVHVHVRIGFI